MLNIKKFRNSTESYLLGESAASVEMMKRQLDDLVLTSAERVEKAVDVSGVSLREIGRRESAALGVVSTAVDDAGATCKASADEHATNRFLFFIGHFVMQPSLPEAAKLWDIGSEDLGRVG